MKTQHKRFPPYKRVFNEPNFQSNDSQRLRQKNIKLFCEKYKNHNLIVDCPIDYNRLTCSKKKKIIFNRIPKTGVTNWNRLFLVFEGKLKNPMEFKNKDRINAIKTNSLKTDEEENELFGSYKNYYKFEKILKIMKD